MTHYEDEKIIAKSSKGWTSILGNLRGSLILTNKRLLIGDATNAILLNEILDVDIDTRTADVTRIMIETEKGTKYLEFARTTTGHTINLLLGDSGWSFSEVSSYTSYWASLITMAKFQYGQSESFEAPQIVYNEKKSNLKPAYISEIIDGATLKTSSGKIIRLADVPVLDINTPHGELAREKLSRLVHKQMVSYNAISTDAFGKLIAYVFVDSTDVNEELKECIRNLEK